MQRVPGWLVDAGMALGMVALALVVEQRTGQRIATATIAGWVGLGSFALLRLGALLARAGRTLGCLFVFAMTWLLPCAAVLYFAVLTDRRYLMRESMPFFILIGFFLIVIMVVTFERLRLLDEARYGKAREPVEP